MTINLDTVGLEGRPEGTVKMINLLKKSRNEENPEINIYLNSRRATLFKKLAEESPDDQEQWKYKYLSAKESLNAGNTWSAIEILQEILRNQDPIMDYIDADVREIFGLLGIAYLRLGEQENCLRYHNHQSCILPISSAAQHQWELGSEKAMEFYALLLRNNPGDLHSRWLYHIAAMTLGKYPEEIPHELLIPILNTDKTIDIEPFRDVAGSLGIDTNGLSGGVAMEDFTGNGFLDIMTSSFGMSDQLFFYENQGNGTFVNKTKEAGLLGITGGLNLIHGDYNNDGYPDILLMRGAWKGSEGEIPNSLLKNNGDGTFEDVTFEAGILSQYPTQTASWVDVDNDGWLDLFIGNESKGETLNFASIPGRKNYPCELFMNNGDGTFRNEAKQAGLDVSDFVKGVSWGDINNDGYPDVYMSVLGGKNRLFINQIPSKGHPSFEEITEIAGVGNPFHSFPVWFWDYDQDGFLDIFVSGYGTEETVPYSVAASFLGLPTGASLPKLYRNNGDLTFTDISREAGLQVPLFSMGSNFGDINNDGYPDFYVGTGVPELHSLIPSQMFLNENGESFTNVTFEGGFGHLQKGHGIAFGDMDNDGDQDIYCVMGGAFEGDIYRNVLFENPGNSNNWIRLKLHGSKANRSAIGARIKLSVSYEDGSRREIFNTVSTGGSFGSSPLQQEIGLGNAVRKIDSIEVRWPDKVYSNTIYTDIDPNTFWEIYQNKEDPVQLFPKKVELTSKGQPHH
ncbi:FG-GAP-like repeat-containing protein [Pleomorphovibrio marinus]|uniref:FG-GAP-like repeat-containing protein n=1 Tax=Pleomorphovibrio marinus TaxID=2164132 RepID=UPI0018E4F584|nr:FG-GAP-like repeat-containing protein [Pleomorphovibrio marinus]